MVGDRERKGCNGEDSLPRRHPVACAGTLGIRQKMLQMISNYAEIITL